MMTSTNIIDLSAIFAIKQKTNSTLHKKERFLRKLARDFSLLCRTGDVARARELYRMYVTEEISEEFTRLLKEEQNTIEREIDD